MVKFEGLNTAAAGVASAGNAYDAYLSTKARRQGEERRQEEGQRLAQTFQLGTQKLKAELQAFEEDRAREATDDAAMRDANVQSLDALEGVSSFLPPEWKERFNQARDTAARSGPAGTAMLRSFSAMMSTAALEHARDKTRAKVYEGRNRIASIAAELQELAGETSGVSDMDLPVDVDGDGTPDYTINSLTDLADRFIEAVDDPNADPGVISDQFDQAVRSLELERGKLRTRLNIYNKWMGRMMEPGGPYALDVWGGDEGEKDLDDAWNLLESYKAGQFQGSAQDFEEEMEALSNGEYLVDMQLDENTRTKAKIQTAVARANPGKTMRSLRGEVNPAAQRVVGDLQAWQRAVSAAAPKDMTGDEASAWMRGAMGDAVDQINAVYAELGLPTIPNTYREGEPNKVKEDAKPEQPQLSEREIIIEEFRANPQHVFAVIEDRFTQMRKNAQGPPMWTLNAVLHESGLTKEDIAALKDEITAAITHLHGKGLWR